MIQQASPLPSDLANPSSRVRCDCGGPILREHVYGSPTLPRTLCYCGYCDWRQVVEVPAGGEARISTTPLVDPTQRDDVFETTRRPPVPSIRLENHLSVPEYQRWRACGKPDMSEWRAAGMPTPSKWKRIEQGTNQ